MKLEDRKEGKCDEKQHSVLQNLKQKGTVNMKVLINRAVPVKELFLK